MPISFSWSNVTANWYSNLSFAMTATSPGPGELLAMSSTIGLTGYGYLQVDAECVLFSEVVDSTHIRIYQRGADGTVAAAHQRGAVIGMTIVPAHLNELRAAILELQEKVF